MNGTANLCRSKRRSNAQLRTVRPRSALLFFVQSQVLSPEQGGVLSSVRTWLQEIAQADREVSVIFLLPTCKTPPSPPFPHYLPEIQRLRQGGVFLCPPLLRPVASALPLGF